MFLGLGEACCYGGVGIATGPKANSRTGASDLSKFGRTGPSSHLPIIPFQRTWQQLTGIRLTNTSGPPGSSGCQLGGLMFTSEMWTCTHLVRATSLVVPLSRVIFR
jgi:hypothetical protein